MSCFKSVKNPFTCWLREKHAIAAVFVTFVLGCFATMYFMPDSHVSKSAGHTVFVTPSGGKQLVRGNVSSIPLSALNNRGIKVLEVSKADATLEDSGTDAIKRDKVKEVIIQ